MAEAVYLLCAATSTLCALLLLRGYRANGSRLQFWAGLCFIGLALNNVMLFVDLIVLVDIDLFWWRTVPAVGGMVLLLYGLIWETH